MLGMTLANQVLWLLASPEQREAWRAADEDEDEDEDDDATDEARSPDGPRVWAVRGLRYEVVIASSVERDGMAVEVWDAEDPSAVTLFEVFHHDPSRSRTMTVWTQRDLPVELVTKALALAETRFRDRPTDK
jgi:hypothetical protein